MPFGVVSGVSRGMAVLDRSGDHPREGAVLNECGASHCNQWDSLHEGRRRSSPQITLGFLVGSSHSPSASAEILMYFSPPKISFKWLKL